jgi:hypothetical protein
MATFSIDSYARYVDIGVTWAYSIERGRESFLNGQVGYQEHDLFLVR